MLIASKQQAASRKPIPPLGGHQLGAKRKANNSAGCKQMHKDANRCKTRGRAICVIARSEYVNLFAAFPAWHGGARGYGRCRFVASPSPPAKPAAEPAAGPAPLWTPRDIPSCPMQCPQMCPSLAPPALPAPVPAPLPPPPALLRLSRAAARRSRAARCPKAAASRRAVLPS